MDDETQVSMTVEDLAQAWLSGWGDHNTWSSTPSSLLEVWLPQRAYVSPRQFQLMIAYLQQLVAADRAK